MPADTPATIKTVANTPSWRFRVDPEFREAVSKVAEEEDEDLSTVLRRAMRAYQADPQGFNAACANLIRGSRRQE